MQRSRKVCGRTTVLHRTHCQLKPLLQAEDEFIVPFESGLAKSFDGMNCMLISLYSVRKRADVSG